MDKLSLEIQNVIQTVKAEKSLKEQFLQRLFQGKLTRDENPQSHFCVYFAGIDPEHKRVFLGWHKKADLWLFSGGHLDKDESSLHQTLEREIGEEWGVIIPDLQRLQPTMLSKTSIKNQKQVCREHYDMWFMVPFDSQKGRFDEHKVAIEFRQYGWFFLDQARTRISDNSTLLALELIKHRFSL